MSAQADTAVLPLGWTEHTGPSGHVYYYNTQTKESTYNRPLTYNAVAQNQSLGQKKKERPLIKTLIPGTDWLRVSTTEGNVFYFHKTRKESFWTIPDEIKDAVQSLEMQEGKNAMGGHEESLEVERIKAEVRDMMKHKAEEGSNEGLPASKESKDSDGFESDTEDSEDDDDWQREAEQTVAEEDGGIGEEQYPTLEDQELREQDHTSLSQPTTRKEVNLSNEEAKALFKVLLREKDVNPLHPWDTSLPLFVSDPRYVLLPSVAARREAFDEYCRERVRELKQAAVNTDKKITSPKDEFEKLLNGEVKSTRTSWNDFRKAWKKDRRFYGWGRDDREREKRFRDFIKELGERKRAAAKKAETNFFILLQEYVDTKEPCIWKEVKRKIANNPRYDAVGSSSLREELFNTFVKGQQLEPIADAKPGIKNHEQTNLELSDTAGGSKGKDKQDRKERAVKEREERIKSERSRLEADIERSKIGFSKKEGDREFRTLLTDAIRDPQSTWDACLAQLQTDPRFTNSTLPLHQQKYLFQNHVSQLRSKYLDNLHALFQSHASSLATNFQVLPLDSLLSSLPVTKLGYNAQTLEREFEKWQRERSYACRKAFDDMLTENSFVDFWGRLGKLGGESLDEKIKIDNEDIGQDENEETSKVDMKALAKSVDLREMEKVLKNDQRYAVFDHVPEQRERWLRDYLSKLSAPKLSVHAPSV